MVLVDFGRSRAGRTARSARSGVARSSDEVSRRALSRVHSCREVGASISVLLLIMVGALVVRWLLSLPQSLAH